jgi:hypothetical protein
VASRPMADKSPLSSRTHHFSADCTGPDWRAAEGISPAKIPLLAACCRCYTSADYFWESRAMEGGR